MKGFISYQELLELYKVSEKTLKSGCFRFRKGGTIHWDNIKIDNCLFIRLDSIPQKTRQKYNIPTAEEWEAKQENERKEKEAKIQALKCDKLYQTLKKEVSINYVTYENKLENGIYSYFMELFISETPHSTTNDEKARMCAKRYVTLRWVLKNHRVVTLGKLHETCLKVMETDPLLRMPTCYFQFSKTITGARKNGILSEIKIAGIQADGTLIVRRSAQKTTEIHTALALKYFCCPAMYTVRQVTDYVNATIDFQKLGLCKVSQSWVKKLKRENINLINTSRGKKWDNDNFLKYQSRDIPTFPNLVWQIDGTRSQTNCYHNGKWVSPYITAVVDVFTKKAIGWHISLSEDRHAIMSALQMAVNVTGQIPKELVSDNFTAFKTDEVQEIKLALEKKGCFWRTSKVGNAQDKTGIERFFGTYQTTTESEFLIYCNQSVHSRKDNKRSAHAINQALKQTQFSLNTMSVYLNEFLLAYNCKKLSKDKSPNELYNDFENPYKIELDLLTRVILFHKTTHLTIRRGEVKLTYKNKSYLYEIFEAEDVLKHSLTTIKVKYDENDLSKVWVLDKYDNLICEAKEKVRTPIATFMHTEADTLELQKTQAKNKKIIRLRQDEFNEKTKILEEKGIIPLTAWALNKEIINNVESQHHAEHYYALNTHIDRTKVQPMPTELQKSEFEKVSGDYGNEAVEKLLRTNKKSHL